MITLQEPFGPDYDLDSAALKKFRAVANRNGGVMKLEQFARRAHAEAVEKAVRAKHRSFLAQGSEPKATPRCASGTWHNTGQAIHDAIRAQQHGDLMRCASQIRRAREPSVWRSMYAAAMLEKRDREAALRRAA